MLKARYPLNSEFSKIVKSLLPIDKNKPAIWFFKKEAKEVGLDAKSSEANNGQAKRASYQLVLDTWRNLKPEARRKYFRLAELDAVRYREQTNLWISHVGSLMIKYNNQTEKVIEELESLTKESIEREILRQPVSRKLDVDEMIEVATTKQLYKYIVNESNGATTNLSRSVLISDVPEEMRTLLDRPRRPKCAFLLYARQNKDEIMAIGRANGGRSNWLAQAAKEWSKLTTEEREPYEQQYQQNLGHYMEAMRKFEEETGCKLLAEARRERRLFKKSLKKNLKLSLLQPLNPRNAFNFFVMENKSMTMLELTEIWRGLPEEKKLKYKEMAADDRERYKKEKKALEFAMKDLSSNLCDGKVKSGES